MDTLWENDKVTKVTRHRSEEKTLTVPPVHQDDAGGKEGDDGGEEIGRGDAVEHHLRCFGRSAISGAQRCSCTSSDDGAVVVAIKHQALGQGALPEATDGGLREREPEIEPHSLKPVLPSP